jgi:methionyl-tRNA formyltransferase
VHVIEEGFDTGPIVAREEIETPEGVRAPELEERLMALGGRLVVEVLPRLVAGEITPTAQDATKVTLAPVPAAADWVMPTNLPARWAYSFARGVATLGGPLAVQVGGTGERYEVRDAVDYGEETMDARVVVEGGGVVRVRFRPGWVGFRVR